MDNFPLDFEWDFGSSAEDIDPAVVGPLDSRIQEIRTTQFPWNTVVHLCRDFGKRSLCRLQRHVDRATACAHRRALPL
jgi:hypothetical protein